MQSQRTRTVPGIRRRHAKGCPSTSTRCDCPWEAWVFDSNADYVSPKTGKRGRKIRKTFATLGAAKAWRADALTKITRGELRAVTRVTLRDASEAWLESAKAGVIRARNGHPYKPSVLRGYESALVNRVFPALGGSKLAEITRHDLQAFADRLLGDGLDPSTIHNVLMPVRAIYGRALRDGRVSVNPTTGLELPAATGRRVRIASVDEAGQLLAALQERDRPLWATALFSGLRHGELRALKWENVDLARGRIDVVAGWDAKEGLIATKNRERRIVPITPRLRDHLDQLKVTSGRDTGYVFGASATQPFESSNIRARAKRAWAAENKRRAEKDVPPLEPITLHECRHTFASLMIAAGVNAKALSTYMGHSGIQITLDRYGHLMPGNEDEAAELLDAYLARADTGARLAAIATA